jgi:hypothetical protein
LEPVRRIPGDAPGQNGNRARCRSHRRSGASGLAAYGVVGAASGRHTSSGGDSGARGRKGAHRTAASGAGLMSETGTGRGVPRLTRPVPGSGLLVQHLTQSPRLAHRAASPVLLDDARVGFRPSEAPESVLCREAVQRRGLAPRRRCECGRWSDRRGADSSCVAGRQRMGMAPHGRQQCHEMTSSRTAGRCRSPRSARRGAEASSHRYGPTATCREPCAASSFLGGLVRGPAHRHTVLLDGWAPCRT